MKPYLDAFLDELELYWFYIKETIEDFFNPPPPTGMV